MPEITSRDPGLKPELLNNRIVSCLDPTSRQILSKEGGLLQQKFFVNERTSFTFFLSGCITLFTVMAVVQPVRAATGGGNWFRPAGVSESVQSNLTAEEAAMLQMINGERVRDGLNKLKPDSQLTGLAREKSRDMVSANYFGHMSPKFGTVYDQLQQSGIVYRTVAENLVGAPGYRRAHASIMNSPAHRSNVLNPSFTRIGIGIIKGGPYGKMVTQILID